MIVIHLDVLATKGTEVLTRQPLQEGKRLWSCLFETFKGRMVVTADPGTDSEQLQEWLKREGFKASFVHIASDLHLDGRSPRSDAVWFIHANMGKVLWYIDVDGTACSEVLRMGITTLFLAIPHIVRPEWNEKAPTREWDALVEELDRQALKKSELSWREE